ncbi:hypothetical protein BZA70DRAFT_270769 [Myxozyma melibiosi]|uniref:Proteasome assembly chaperone 1 n=1 Tax=Myxozyma melibiosi TaxID=54550 RepID=A0ABR1FDV1_9ASCO
MLFKPWLDVPPPRHELHDDSSSDEDIHPGATDEDDGLFEQQETSLQDTIPVSVIDVLVNDEISRLVVVSPALEPVMLGLGQSQQVGSATLNFATALKKVNLLVMEIMYNPALRFHWIKIPQVPPKECYTLAQYLLTELHPEILVIMAPLFVDLEHPIQVLASSKSGVRFEESLHLKPPHHITGINASLISYAEISQSKAVAILVAGEGVPDHEYVEEEYTMEAANTLSKVLDANGAPYKLDLAVIRHRVRSNGMYV